MNTNNKRRLVQALSFDYCNKGRVIHKVNGGYQIEKGDTFYTGMSSGSSNGCFVFDDKEKAILDLVWDNKDWFIDANTFTHVEMKAEIDSITIRFDPMDIADSQTLMRGIKFMFENYFAHEREETYIWDHFISDIQIKKIS